MLADSINKSLGNSLYYEYNRHDKHEKRNKNEIGINSIRGGNIVGEHTVQFLVNMKHLKSNILHIQEIYLLKVL